jgi:SAM-dependent methyltransferase
MSSQKSLFDFITCPPESGSLWSGQYKIPWNDPDFSRRMLNEHLSQDHDLASRSRDKIQSQVSWIHNSLCGNKPAKLLDLGCGPGLYLKEFIGLDYNCRGIDFSPASIEHARSQLGDQAELIQGDIREQDFGSGYSLVMMIYGELNVFSPSECRGILRNAFDSLAPGGKLLLEVQTFDAVKRTGSAPNNWYKTESGLFSEHPHICITENHWIGEQSTAMQQFVVINACSGDTSVFRSTTKAWTEEEYLNLLAEAGFDDSKLQTKWPENSGNFCCFLADRPVD